MSKKELQEALTTLAKNDKEICGFLMATYNHHLDQNNHKQFNTLVSGFIRSAKDRHGFIDYYKSQRLGKQLYDLLHSYRGGWKAGIGLCKGVIEKTAKAYLHADDSTGLMGMAIDEAFNMLHQWLETPGETEPAAAIFDLTVNEQGKEIFEGGFDWANNYRTLAVKACRNKRQAATLLKILEAKIKEKANEKFGSFAIDYISELIVELLETWYDKPAVEAFIKQNIERKSIREKALQLAFDNEDYDQVKQLALDGVAFDTENGYAGLVSKWKSWLEKHAEATGDISAQIQLNEEAYLKHGEMDYYQKLKSLLPEEEFQKKRQAWIRHFSNNNSRFGGAYFSTKVADIYLAEAEYEDLMDLMEAAPSLFSLDNYASILVKRYPERYASLYNGCVRVEMETMANGRDSYKRCISYLKKISNLGAPELARKTADLWRQQFPRRKALLEELDKANFR
ncbi:MAG: hypothetical protein R3B47_04250 [Bacteroidia bacterium]